MLAVDGNTLALSGRSCVLPYLGMGPAEYYRIWEQMPDVFHGQTGPEPQVIALLQQMGVSHLLTEEPLPGGWPATLLWSGRDAFLGRKGYPQLFLYRFDASLGRAYLDLPNGTRPVELVKLHPNHVVLDCDVPESADLILTDLMYPGWVVEVDGNPAVAKPDTLFRTVRLEPGQHRVTWRYRPWDVIAGALVSICSLLGIGISIIAARRLRPSS